MGRIPVWTSTQNPIDRESEDGYIEAHENELIRIENAELTKLDPENLDLQKSLNVKSLVRLPATWIDRSVPKVLEIAESGLDLSLKHVRIALEGSLLKLYAVANDRAFCSKTDVELSCPPDKNTEFGIVVSAEHLRIIHGFISKAFGSGVCEIGVKAPADNCESMLLVCYSKAVDDSHDANFSKQPETAKLKAAMFKLERSVGHLPLEMFDKPKMSDTFQAAVTPNLRWIFAQKTPYIEFRSNNGMLEAQYESSGKTVRSPLGAKIVSNVSISDMHGVTLASVDGKYISDIFAFCKEPLTITFGVIERSESRVASPIYLDSNELSAVIAQSYKIDLPEDAVYVTRKKGKVEETSEKEATERAIKQNKKAIEPTGEVAAPTGEIAAPTPEIVVDEALLNELSDCERMAEASKAPSQDVLSEILVTLKEILHTLQTAVQPKSKAIIPSKNLNGGELYDLDVIINWLSQRIGEEISLAIARESLGTIKYATISAAINKLGKYDILDNVRRGVYKVPEDFLERCKKLPRRYPKVEQPKETTDPKI